jgi:LysM repeat protein
MISSDELKKAGKRTDRTFLQVLSGTVGSQGFERGAIFIAENYGTNVDALVKANVVRVLTEDEAMSEDLTLPAQAESVTRRQVGHLTPGAEPIVTPEDIDISQQVAPEATAPDQAESPAVPAQTAPAQVPAARTTTAPSPSGSDKAS